MFDLSGEMEFAIDEATGTKLREMLDDIDVTRTPRITISDRHGNTAIYRRVDEQSEWTWCKGCRCRNHTVGEKNMSRWSTPGEAFAYETGYIEGRADAIQQQWIPCTPETMPENEQDVLVTVEVRTLGRKSFRRVIRAFYTDGRHTDADSAYSWNEFPDPQYDDDGNMIIPKGWWESSDYYEQLGMVDDFVVAWMPFPEPWKDGDHHD